MHDELRATLTLAEVEMDLLHRGKAAKKLEKSVNSLNDQICRKKLRMLGSPSSHDCRLEGQACACEFSPQAADRVASIIF